MRLSTTIYRKKQAANRSPCWTVEWKEAVIFDGGELRKSRQFADITLGEANPIEFSVLRPDADSKEQAKWA